MFVLKEKLINSILIKVKGEGCVLYSRWIPPPLKKGKKKRNPSAVCYGLSIPHTSLSPSFGPRELAVAGSRQQSPGRDAALHGCPDLPTWSLDLELDSAAQINHSLTVSLHFNGL